VLPGQGLLTIVVGLLLIDFPGKYSLERRLAGQSHVFRMLNWIRRKHQCAPLVHPAASASRGSP
jgi:hypothetical protein